MKARHVHPAHADYKGFATWVDAHQERFSKLEAGLIVFGEWCGPGVEKGVAISRLPTKCFVVFAIEVNGWIMYDPIVLREKLPAQDAPAALHVLPWEGSPITVDFGSRESVERAAAELNQRVATVEQEDPWAQREFGISGLGEGLVLYPVTINGLPPALEKTELSALMFKAKGEKHRTAGSRAAVTVAPAMATSVQDFATLMVTEARLQQGLSAVCNDVRGPKHTGAFLNWIAADVRKESVAELEVAKLTWEQVDKAVRSAARAWFIQREVT